MLEGYVPYPEQDVKYYRAKGYWKDITIGDTLVQAAARLPFREALVGTSPVLGEVRDTYAELLAKVDRLALHLLRLGVKPGERALFQLPNIPEFIYLYYALQQIGAIPVMSQAAFRRREMDYLCEHTEATVYACQDHFRNFDYTVLASELQTNSPSLRIVLIAGNHVGPGQVSMGELLTTPVKDEEMQRHLLVKMRPNPDDVAVFQLSGGTTGLPKVIPRTHNAYLCCSEAAAKVGCFNKDTVFLAATPLPHNFTITSPGIHGAVLYGSKIVLPVSPAPDKIFQLVEQEKVTYMPGVPAMLISWMNYPELSRFDTSSLQVIISGGSKLNEKVAGEVESRLGVKLQQTLGMAEGLNTFTRLDDPVEVFTRTVGRPLLQDDEIRIVDDHGDDVPAGEMGELWTRGPYTIRGYYRAEEHNRRAFSPDGFYKTGDMVSLDPSGNLIVEGRKKDLINRGGEKISAEEIENLILSHPKIVNTAVVSMPDPVLGEKLCAYVQLKPETKLELSELRSFLTSKQIAPFKLPERMEVIDEFPLTAVGKISKKYLREDIAAKLIAETNIN